MYRPDGTMQVLGRPGRANNFVFSPGCGRVAEGRLRIPKTGGTGLLVRDVAGGPPLVQLSSYWPVESPRMAWSPDGSLIADLDDSRGEYRRQAIRITDVATGRVVVRKRIRRDWGWIDEGAFSPDSRSVVFKRQREGSRVADDALTIFDIATGSFRDLLRRRASFRSGETGNVAWSPRGDRIAVVIDERLHLLDVDGRDLGVVAPRKPVSVFAWSPDGASLAILQRRRLRRTRPARRWPVREYAMDVAVVAAEPGARSRPVLRDADEQSWPVWSPDGARLAFFSH